MNWEGVLLLICSAITLLLGFRVLLYDLNRRLYQVSFLFAVLLVRIASIARSAELRGMRFGAYFCYGVSLVLFIQLFINVGVNIGLLPTKGLTLPLLSYGGSSLLVTLCMLGIVLRVNSELVKDIGQRQLRRGNVLDVDIGHALAVKNL